MSLCGGCADGRAVGLDACHDCPVPKRTDSRLTQGLWNVLRRFDGPDSTMRLESNFWGCSEPGEWPGVPRCTASRGEKKGLLVRCGRRRQYVALTRQGAALAERVRRICDGDG